MFHQFFFLFFITNIAMVIRQIEEIEITVIIGKRSLLVFLLIPREEVEEELRIKSS